MKHCKITDCNKKHRSLGYCSTHYARLKRNGHTGLQNNRTAWNKKEPIEKLCKKCSKEFSVRPSLDRIQYCSYRCSKLGKSPWNKGKKGVQKAWNKGLEGFQAGDKHPSWRGGSGTKRHQDMGKIEYRAWRDAVFKKDNYTCQICQDYGVSFHADHIERWADNKELRYSVNNGRTLCVPCHYFVTFKKRMKVGTNWCNYTLTRKRG